LRRNIQGLHGKGGLEWIDHLSYNVHLADWTNSGKADK